FYRLLAARFTAPAARLGRPAGRKIPSPGSAGSDAVAFRWALGLKKLEAPLKRSLVACGSSACLFQLRRLTTCLPCAPVSLASPVSSLPSARAPRHKGAPPARLGSVKRCGGGRAKTFGQPKQVFCDPAKLGDACLQGARRAQVKRLLLALPQDIQERALARVPEDFRNFFSGQVQRAKVCQGMGRERCVFALASRGGPARVARRGLRCIFCAPEDLWPTCDEEEGRAKALAQLRRLSPTARQLALEERLPEEHVPWFVAQLAVPGARRPPPAVRRGKPAAAIPKMELAARWGRVLAARRPLNLASATAKKKYREKVLEDRSRARRRMGQTHPRTLRGAPVANDSGLPPAKRSKRAEAFERWCLSHSWAACEKCGLMLPRDLTEATLSKDQKAGVAAGRCWLPRRTRSAGLDLARCAGEAAGPVGVGNVGLVPLGSGRRPGDPRGARVWLPAALDNDAAAMERGLCQGSDQGAACRLAKFSLVTGKPGPSIKNCLPAPGTGRPPSSPGSRPLPEAVQPDALQALLRRP
ncbi:unnamed protein product, partial [Effrenium voratum]